MRLPADAERDVVDSFEAGAAIVWKIELGFAQVVGVTTAEVEMFDIGWAY